MVNVCVVCGARQGSETAAKAIIYHRIPPRNQGAKRKKWLQGLQLEENAVTGATRVCSKHFWNGVPCVTLGKNMSEHVDPTKRRRLLRTPLSPPPSASTQTKSSTHSSTHIRQCVNCIALQDELKKMQVALANSKFGIHSLEGDDSLIRYYTGFPSFGVFRAFYDFLGPSVDQLTYWGTDEPKSKSVSRTKLCPMDQLLMTLMRLRLNLEEQDLAVRFGISQPTASKYFITWVSFLYRHLSEIDWWPSQESVFSTSPVPFKEKYPLVFAIIDATEVFIETPSDLFLQSSTWSNYKSHNTCKFLVACTPNGCICFISEGYVGSISDVELTKVSGFLERIAKCPGTAVMADKGFTIKDMLKSVNVDLNIPPFVAGKVQLLPSQVQDGRNIASLRIHVERAINRIKNFQILKGVFRLSSARLLNQIITVCAYLTNFHPVLVPPSLSMGSTVDFLEPQQSEE